MRPLIILSIIFLFVYQPFAQNSNIKLEHIGIDNGLSQGFITSMTQDSAGFMWFGTNDGLNRYDGYNFITYYSSSTISSTISNSQITNLVVDKNKHLWIGTYNGLNYFDQNTGNFIRYFKKTPGNISYKVSTLLADEKGNIWFSYSNDSYLNCFNPKTGELNSIALVMDDEKSKVAERESTLQDNILYASSLLLSTNHQVWIGTNKGTLLAYDTRRNQIVRNISLKNRSTITRIIEDNDKTLWVSTINAGFCHIDPVNNNVGKMILDDLNIDHASEIGTMILNSDKTIWIGMLSKGFCIFNKERNKIEQHQIGNDFVSSYNPRGICSFYIDRSGLLWCGTNGYGIYCYSPFGKKFNNITYGNREIKQSNKTCGIDFISVKTPDNQRINSIHFQSVRGIYVDDKYIYVGGYIGFDKIDRYTGLITNIMPKYVPYAICPDPVNSDILWIGIEGTGNVLYKFCKSTNTLACVKKINCTFIYSLLFDRDGILWIGYVWGVIRYNTHTGQQQIFGNKSDVPGGIQTGAIKAIYQDSGDYLWFGSDIGGASRYNITTGHFDHYTQIQDNTKSLSNNSVLAFFEDAKGNMWIGTGGGGLNRLDKSRTQFDHFTTNDGLPNDFVYSIVSDNSGCLWLSTNKGISKFNPENEEFINFSKSDGLQENEFNTGSHFKSADGTIYFGGINGITWFEPSGIKKNSYRPEVVLTSVTVENEDKKEIIQNINTDKFFFSYKDLVITFEFSALNFYLSFKNKYEYFLHGLDNKWIPLGSEHQVSFTGLKEGSYILEIKASNNDGVRCEKPLSIEFIITPPYWKTTWFYILCGIFLLLMVDISFMLYTRNIRKRNVQLENAVEDRTKEIHEQKEAIQMQNEEIENSNQKLQKLNATKDKFFSIIAHDLRNPFNAILGFTELLDDEYDNFSDKERKRFIKNIHSSATNTFKLLQNLLEWSGSLSGSRVFKPEFFDIQSVIKENLEILNNQAHTKGIKIISLVPGGTFVNGDKNMISAILRNLISNAIKFSFPGSEVKISKSIHVSKEDEKPDRMVQITVSDSGIGIHASDLASLFNIDKKLMIEGTAKEQGTGLGLIICKEFIDRNNGKIWVESEPGRGSSFHFTIPEGKE
ncbi:MAG: ATP-binding protein [Bacteroidia bacterium]|nr:ATP-binding protein [Bacteroidia bacterium]